MIIINGRFQPFHNGHLELLDKVRDMYPNQSICIAVIKNHSLFNSDNEFDKCVEKQFIEGRNPFSSSQTLEMINSVIKKRGYEKVFVNLIPKPSELIWPIIEALFDEERTWIIPKLSEDPNDWENLKANFYESMNDKVVRINIDKKINATDIRQTINEQRYDIVKKYVPLEVYEEIKEIFKKQKK